MVYFIALIFDYCNEISIFEHNHDFDLKLSMLIHYLLIQIESKSKLQVN